MFSRPQKALRGSRKLAALPAPAGGLNASSPAMGMAPTDCMVLFNMLAAEYGLRVRLGSREWVTNLSNDTHTLIPYTGSTSSETRLFGAAIDGIYDHTISDASPAAAVLSFATPSGNAGYGIAHGHTTTAGNFLWYADEVNGLHLYTESTQTWAAVSALSITGVNPADIVFVTNYKGFTLFAERDTANIWILPVNSISGAVTRLGLGYKLQAGGDIVGMWSWTYDGGVGLDDLLVVVSRGGDVIVFNGTDPTDSASFGIQGVWGVGKMPAGRNVATTFGGDLLLMTRSGVVPMTRLVTGRTVGAEQYQTSKISNLFNSLMLTYGDDLGWSMRLHPEESALIVTVPTGDGSETQLAMSLDTKSWSLLRDLPMHACAAHEGKLYYSTTDGSICINDGYLDGRILSDADTYAAIQFSGISSFQNLATGSKKRVHMIRPHFMSQSSAPTFAVEARFDFDLTEVGAVTLEASSGAAWDVGLWDEAIWGGAYAGSSELRGASGMGSNVAIAWAGASVDRTVLTGFEMSFSEGGML